MPFIPNVVFCLIAVPSLLMLSPCSRNEPRVAAQAQYNVTLGREVISHRKPVRGCATVSVHSGLSGAKRRISR
ncbi:hypothetical protein ACFL0Q_01510 [Thermodesulfobacteriota bacterium]